MEFRVVGPPDEQALATLFADVDVTFFRPHPFTPEEAHRIATLGGWDVYALLFEQDVPVAYGMLRGWDEGYSTPSLGLAVRTSAQGRGCGRAMMNCLHAEARARGCDAVRLRVHPENVRARRLYESMGYEYQGEDRDELVMAIDLALSEASAAGSAEG
jgi:ribosomal protein S18 acetylase RimI-like enzyme